MQSRTPFSATMSKGFAEFLWVVGAVYEGAASWAIRHIFGWNFVHLLGTSTVDYCPIIMEFSLTKVSNGLMDKLKEFERPLFQMPMEIERVKTGSSSGNHGTVTKLASASRNENFIKGSKEESEILDEARQCYALKNLANPIGKGFGVCAVACQIMECSSGSCPNLLNSSQYFQCSTYLKITLHTNSRRC
jgi:hypothetical protein